LSFLGNYPPVPTTAHQKRERTRADLLVAIQEILLDGGIVTLSVPRVIARAGVSQGTFYNYFERLDGALDAVGDLLLAEHVRVLEIVRSGSVDVVEVFARSTKQTLMVGHHMPEVGRLLFDSGLPVDRLMAGLRAHMHRDVLIGLSSGDFTANDSQATASVLGGAIAGAWLDIHRGRLSVDSIPSVVEYLLQVLGVESRTAVHLARASQQFHRLRPLPLSPLMEV
jgi:AcrR family transcriptional regulator